MAKKNKLWFSGEDEQLAARFTKCLTKALYNRRVSYLRAKAEQAASEISIEECSEEVDKMYVPTTRPVEEIVESKLMWAHGPRPHRQSTRLPADASTADRYS